MIRYYSLFLALFLGLINTTLFAQGAYLETMAFDKDPTTVTLELEEKFYPKDIQFWGQALSTHIYRYKAFLLSSVNANTPGYKISKISPTRIGDQLVSNQFYVWEKENSVYSKRNLDVYVTGKKNFITLEMQDGSEGYTQDGRFILSETGLLVTISSDLPVMGKNGHIYLESDEVLINERGEIYYGDQLIDTLKITSFSSTDGLWGYNGTLFYVAKPENVEVVDDAEYSISQGFYEASNIPLGMMADLNTIEPIYESIGYSMKKYLENYEKLFQAVETKQGE